MDAGCFRPLFGIRDGPRMAPRNDLGRYSACARFHHRQGLQHGVRCLLSALILGSHSNATIPILLAIEYASISFRFDEFHLTAGRGTATSLRSRRSSTAWRKLICLFSNKSNSEHCLACNLIAFGTYINENNQTAMPETIRPPFFLTVVGVAGRPFFCILKITVPIFQSSVPGSAASLDRSSSSSWRSSSSLNVALRLGI